LSLALIAKNEEEVIGRVLMCAQLVCDELIVVDTGSTDRTVERAEAAGARVHRFEWCDDFAAARNFAFSKCSGDWILWLDADDLITAEDAQRFRQLKAALDDQAVDVVFCAYQLAFGAAGECTTWNLRERLIRRGAGLVWDYPIHSALRLPMVGFWNVRISPSSIAPCPASWPSEPIAISRFWKKWSVRETRDRATSFI
jgi:glycosyltransferase involved in cell wall biosynthesis